MRVFITGATGYIGTAVTSALIHAGHEVTALVRPESSAQNLERGGVRIVRGALDGLADHRQELERADVVVHTASDPKNQVAADAAAIDAMVGVEGPRIIYTSGVWVFGDTGDRVVDESTEPEPLEIVSWRPGHEKRVLSEGAGRAAVLRPGCVYGGSQSLLAGWFAAAEAGEPLELIGDGLNRWAMIHEDDLADLYLKIAESEATGIFHGVDDSRTPLGQVAKAIIEARGSSSEIVHKPFEVAREQLGLFADALALDQHVSSAGTRSQLDWEPAVSFLHSIERQWEEWDQAKH